MSFWTSLRDSAESLFSTATPLDVRGESARKQTSGVTGAANAIRNAEEAGVNKITGRTSSADKREQASLINDQIDAYRQATELTQKQIDQVQNEKAVAKRQVNEKQIRALRNNYRPAGGFLNNQGSTLGNQGDLPNSLGS